MKNEIMPFAGKIDGTGDHVKQNKLDPQIYVSHVFSKLWKLEGNKTTQNGQGHETKRGPLGK
jgi:hypothetical protein